MQQIWSLSYNTFQCFWFIAVMLLTYFCLRLTTWSPYISIYIILYYIIYNKSWAYILQSLLFCSSTYNFTNTYLFTLLFFPSNWIYFVYLFKLISLNLIQFRELLWIVIFFLNVSLIVKKLYKKLSFHV